MLKNLLLFWILKGVIGFTVFVLVYILIILILKWLIE